MRRQAQQIYRLAFPSGLLVEVVPTNYGDTLSAGHDACMWAYATGRPIHIVSPNGSVVGVAALERTI